MSNDILISTILAFFPLNCVVLLTLQQAHPKIQRKEQVEGKVVNVHHFYIGVILVLVLVCGH